MNARDYIYNALSESMNAVRDNLEDLSSYLDLDFDDYFGSANSQIVEDENGIEVLSEVSDEYVEGKVVCTAEEGREMFDNIRDDVLKEILQEKVDNQEEIIRLHKEDIKEAEGGDNYTFPLPIEVEDGYTEVNQFATKSKDLKLIYSQTWNENGYSEEVGISTELYDFIVHKFNVCFREIPIFLGCTHFFEHEDADGGLVIYGFIEQKEEV